MGFLLRAIFIPGTENDHHTDLGQMLSEQHSRESDERRKKMAEENKRMHAKLVAYENYINYSNTPEEKAINRSIWLNL